MLFSANIFFFLPYFIDFSIIIEHNPRLLLSLSVALYFTSVELICLYSEKLHEYHHLLFLGIVIENIVALYSSSVCRYLLLMSQG